ncbi:hypothetical protein [Pseudomonas oryzihabitans]|uniref:hypothetical protein n=1 Tax=Pseudomonas oryzihabitans TaxID=47885 RepID=UPI00241CE4AA|nr:hypothetical protein [Pseudomonas oryzihabitans]
MLRKFSVAIFVFGILASAVLGSKLIAVTTSHLVEQVALSHIRHDSTGLATLSRSKPLTALTPEQIESAIEGRKLVDEARRYMKWVSIIAHLLMLALFTAVLIKVLVKNEPKQ